MSERLGPWFTWAELTRTSSGLANEPSEDVRTALLRLHRLVLHPAREALGRPVIVTSGYRSPEVNARVGGAPNSKHVSGEAVDVRVHGYTSEKLARLLLELELPLAKLIWYRASPHVHLEVAPPPEVLCRTEDSYLVLQPRSFP